MIEPHTALYDEILPELYVGNIAACDALRAQGVNTLCVLEGPHSGACAHRPILAAGAAGPSARVLLLDAAADLIGEIWQRTRSPLLVHCAAGIERSPLTVVWYLCTRRGLPFDLAYALVRARRPLAEDRRHWLERLPVPANH